MYRRPGDLKWRGRRPKHQRHHGRGYSYYRYPHGDYWRWLKSHAHRSERQEVRLCLAAGKEIPPRRRNSALWEWH